MPFMELVEEDEPQFSRPEVVVEPDLVLGYEVIDLIMSALFRRESRPFPLYSEGGGESQTSGPLLPLAPGLAGWGLILYNI